MPEFAVDQPLSATPRILRLTLHLAFCPSIRAIGTSTLITRLKRTFGHSG
jgi:hypothetical protein